MRDIELYRTLLGLTAPWTVAGVDVDMAGQRVVVGMDAGPGPYACRARGTPGPRYDSKPRRWRDLDTMQCTTWIEADVPRVECATHGIKQLRVPWAEPASQCTAPFERLAIDLLRECSITRAVRLLRISWDEGWGIKGRTVKRGLAPQGHEVVAWFGVDEKAIAKLIRRHLPNLLTYLRHRLTNAGLERINAVIQGIKKTARGFRNAEHFKTAIYFHCGALDLYSHESRYSHVICAPKAIHVSLSRLRVCR